MATEVLPTVTLNPALRPDELLDIEVGFRDTFNYMLDAEENDRSIRDAGRGIIMAFLEHLKMRGIHPREVLVEFAVKTSELVESATCHQSQIRAASAKCLLGLWAERTRVFTSEFQRVFFALKKLEMGFPRLDLFEYACYKTLIAHEIMLKYSFLWPVLYANECSFAVAFQVTRRKI
jgi:hypothetical protein